MDARLERHIQRMYYSMFPAPGARPIFVHGTSGDNANDGYTPDRAVLTVTQALSLATTWQGDIIYARSIGTPTGETWPIVANKADVSIVGWREEGNRSTNIVSSGDVAAITITENNISLIGIGFGCGGANHGAIEFSTHWSSTLFKECWFGVQYGMLHGIDAGDGLDQAYLTVLDCWFGRLITGNGINIPNNATWAQLGLPGHGNIFHSVQGIGINATNLHEGRILDNRHRLPSNTKGKAITLGAGSQLCYVDGNRANYGKTDMAANPFLDLGVATNTWGLNYKGVTATLPAVA